MFRCGIGRWVSDWVGHLVCGTLHQYHYWFDSNSDYGYTYFLKSEQLIAWCRRRECHVCGSSHARLGHRWYTGMDRSEVRLSSHFFFSSLFSVCQIEPTLKRVLCSSFAELGSMIPLNGGAQAYLAYAYGPLVSYLYAWTAITLLKPCSAAIISLIFGYVPSSPSLPFPFPSPLSPRHFPPLQTEN